MKKTVGNSNGLKIICAGALVFVAFYFGIFMTYEEKKEELLSEVSILEAEISNLEVHEPNLDKYKQGIEDAKTYINTELNRYPVDILPEDTILWALSLKNTIGGDFSTISFGDKESLFEFNASIIESDVYVSKLMTAEEIKSSYDGTFTYEQLKNALDFVYSTNHRTAINSIVMAPDEEGEIIDINMDVSKYLVSYEGAEYVPYTLPQVEVGDTNIFK